MTDLVQIIPAQGWYACVIQDNDKVVYEPLVAWGLTSEGEVVGLMADYNEITTPSRYAYGSEYKFDGYINARDTPEGTRRQKRLESLEESLGVMDDKTALRAVSSATLAAVDAQERGEDGSP